MKFQPRFSYSILQRSETSLLDRVRRSVRAVVPCNVLLTDPLMDYKDAACTATDGHSAYDVIISTLCLEFASLSPEEYSAAVGNVARLLRPSGYFIIQVNIFSSESDTHANSRIINQRTFTFLLSSPSLFSFPPKILIRERWATAIIGTTITNFRPFRSAESWWNRHWLMPDVHQSTGKKWRGVAHRKTSRPTTRPFSTV